MRFASLLVDGQAVGSVGLPGGRWVPLATLDETLSGDVMLLIQRGLSRAELQALGQQAGKLAERHALFEDEVAFAPPYRRPRKIWGIGLNYQEHAADLGAAHPEEPASFIKGDHTIIGPGDPIVLPAQSTRVTSEAELGLVIGRECRDVSEEKALEYVFGVCAILDQTAEDILRRNSRYLTRSKNFPTFFSFGPEVVTLDELVPPGWSLRDVQVTTCRNGEIVRSQPIANMQHSPEALIGFHSQMMPLFPGDVISTGTPGAAVVAAGDWMECRIGGLAPLRNPVSDGQPR